jgi:peptidoglycan/xylan/chitin deacetylase (PgdA/CDA1 family)
LRESKDVLEQLLGSEVLSFAYPYGAVGTRARELVSEAGYKFAVAGDSGPLRFADAFTEIRRTQVFPWTSSFGFWKKTLPVYQKYRSFKP